MIQNPKSLALSFVLFHLLNISRMSLASTAAAIGATYGALAFFLALTLTQSYKHIAKGHYDADKYHSARNSQGPLALALSFFASGAGAWILFAVPEAAILGGPIALVGYALSTIVPLLIFSAISPTLRRELPHGITFFEMVDARYGWKVNVYVTLTALFYMFLYLAAEFTSVGSAVGLLSGTGVGFQSSGLAAIVGTSIVTLVYTSFGGLPVSLVTDRVQGFGTLAFAILICIAAFGFSLFPRPLTAAEAAADNTTTYDAALDQHNQWATATSFGISNSVGKSFSMCFILVIAVTSANMLHSGFQQRIWAASNNQAARQGLWIASLLNVPFMLLFGALGMVAYAKFGATLLSPAYIAFLSAFLLLQELHIGWQVVAIILTVLMVASSADTIQTGFTALLTPATEKLTAFAGLGELKGSKKLLALNFAITAVVNVPAIILATQNISVLTLFVMADLLAATCICPILLGLSPRVHPNGALAGCVAGLLCALLCYGIGINGEAGSFVTLFQAGGLYADTSLLAFCLTPSVSALVTLGVSGGCYPTYRFEGYSSKPSPTTAGEVHAEAEADSSTKTDGV